MSYLLAQNDLRTEILLARALSQLQSISAAVAFESATNNFPNDAETEPMTPPTKDMGVDSKFWGTTTMGMADTLPINHTANYGLLEGNPCPSDMKDELITTLPSTSSMSNQFQNQQFICQCCVGNWNSINTKPPSKSPINNSNGFGLQLSLPWNIVLFVNFEVAESPIFIPWLHGGSAKTRPAGPRRGRPPSISGEHSRRKVLLLFMIDVVAVVHRAQSRKLFFCNGHVDRRDIGVAALRTTIWVRVQDPIYLSAFYVLSIQSCPFFAFLIWRRVLND